jgi:hypothetical protein
MPNIEIKEMKIGDKTIRVKEGDPGFTATEINSLDMILANIYWTDDFQTKFNYLQTLDAQGELGVMEADAVSKIVQAIKDN